MTTGYHNFGRPELTYLKSGRPEVPWSRHRKSQDRAASSSASGVAMLAGPGRQADIDPDRQVIGCPARQRPLLHTGIQQTQTRGHRDPVQRRDGAARMK